MHKFWRGIAIFVLGGVLGTGFGVALGFFIFPFVFPPPTASEQLAEADRTLPVARGTFIHANPSDPVHYGKGKVSVYERAVFLEPDFEVGPGPAFHVYLVPKASIRSSADMKDVIFVGSRRFAIIQRQSALRHPRRHRSAEISECDHLVRTFRRPYFASGPDLNRCRRVKTGSLEQTRGKTRLTGTSIISPTKESSGP
jgi:hypothetical protein